CTLLFSTASAPAEISTLSLHDALPICRRDEVAPAQLEGVDTQALSRDVDQALADERALEAARAAIRSLRRLVREHAADLEQDAEDRKSTRLNSSHDQISYAVFCLKKKK